MEIHQKLIIVNGEDKTESIASFQFVDGKCNITYKNSPRVYCYNSWNVKVLKCNRRIEPETVIFQVNGRTLSDVVDILDYDGYYSVSFMNRSKRSYRKSDVSISLNCLAQERSENIYHYFTETASATGLETEDQANLLEIQYNKIKAVAEETILAKYLDMTAEIETREKPDYLIYPFGLNQSQKMAVENAFSSQISIIQGPPGTGKTQTILNIIANAVQKGKTVAVVSNNNSATKNVQEKLEKQELSFIAAFLGSNKNKGQFIAEQTKQYPDMEKWVMEAAEKEDLSKRVKKLSQELNEKFDIKNHIAAIAQDILLLESERFYFKEYYHEVHREKIKEKRFQKLSSDKLTTLWLEYENAVVKGEGRHFLKRLWFILRFQWIAITLLRNMPKDVIPFLQDLYYPKKIQELQDEKLKSEELLEVYHFDEQMEELRENSLRLFKAGLAERYHWRAERDSFFLEDLRNKSAEFVKEYPVVLSTTYSIKGVLDTNYTYDYLIIDEASQVDLATGVLAFSCAKNLVIVGDQMQLPNVLDHETIQRAEAVWKKYNIDEAYRFTKHSLLSSAAAIWKDAPSTLLREHYRCHPKIANFFNQKFYDGKLIVMTEDHGEANALALYRMAEGNHARGHMNQRQIDVIWNEALPALQQDGHYDIGIIAPYRDQVKAMQAQMKGQHQCEIDTVHKFQGREKEAIILTSVDNVIGSFVDDPQMLNVAVSRAIRSLSVVMSDQEENENTNYGALAKYIEYHNLKIVESKVFSVFDMLYKGFNEKRKEFLKDRKRISEYDSENLAYAVIETVLQMPAFSDLDCAGHVSLAMLMKDRSNLTKEEARYALNPLTHVDFLLFDRMNKAPVLAIEVDGVSFHRAGSRQWERDKLKDRILEKYDIPLLRLRTDESNEEKRIIAMLEKRRNNNSKDEGNDG